MEYFLIFISLYLEKNVYLKKQRNLCLVFIF